MDLKINNILKYALLFNKLASMTKNDAKLILDLSLDFSPEQLEKAYRKKVFELHPDRNKSNSANNDFIIMQSAYELLKNLSNKSNEQHHSSKSNEQYHSSNFWENIARQNAEYHEMRYQRDREIEKGRESYKIRKENFIKKLDNFSEKELYDIALKLEPSLILEKQKNNYVFIYPEAIEMGPLATGSTLRIATLNCIWAFTEGNLNMLF